MNTFSKTVAFLITAAAFTACSTATVEPIRNIQPRIDTTLSAGPNRDVTAQRQPIAEEAVQTEQTGTISAEPIVVDTRVRKQRPNDNSLEQPISF